MRFVFAALPYGRVVRRTASRRFEVIVGRRLGRCGRPRRTGDRRRSRGARAKHVASPKNGHAGAKRRLPRKARSRHVAENRTRETESVGGFMGARVKA